MRFYDAATGTDSSHDVKLGYPIPSGIATKPVRSGWVFHGWYGGQNGTGDCYYDMDLDTALEVYPTVGDITLYAYWTKAVDTIWVNGEGITAGISEAGNGWSYSGKTSTLTLSSEMEYQIEGEETNGEIVICAISNCTLVARDLTIDASKRRSRPVLRMADGVSVALELDGEVYLNGGDGAPGIQVEESQTIEISGDGELEATSGDVDGGLGSSAAAIGSRSGKSAGTIKISSEDVAVTAVSAGGAGIGGGAGGAGGTLSVTGGSVVALGGQDDEEPDLYSADIGPGYSYSGSDSSARSTIDPARAYVAPDNFRLAATPSNLGPKFYTPNDLQIFCVAFTGLVANASVSISGVERAYLPPYDIKTTGNGAVYLWFPASTTKRDVSITAAGVTLRYIFRVVDRHIAAPYASGLRVNGRDVYLGSGEGWTFDEDAVKVDLAGAGPFVIDGFLVAARAEATADCTVVLSNGTFQAGGDKPGFLVADGVNVKMDVFGSSRLYGGSFAAGLEVKPTATLALDGSGTLTAKGFGGSAAIGGSSGNGGSSGTIAIAGGTIAATGSAYMDQYGGAGIGGGAGGTTGSIAISGGNITAKGGYGGAGIGSGSSVGTNNVASATAPRISIEGTNSVVTATGGDYAAAIGGGSGVAGGTITVSDGMVTATGGWGGSGIGGGHHGAGGTLTFAGGKTSAAGGYAAAGVGGGHSGAGGAISIGAARVSATGGEQAAGIGGGAGANGGALSITAGTVSATGGQYGNSLGTGYNGTDGTVTITGGAIYAAYANPRPVNASSADLFPLTIETGVKGLVVTNLSFSHAAYYGFEAARTDASGNLTVWLPPTPNNGVCQGHVAFEDGTAFDFYYAMTAGGTGYSGNILTANGELVFSAIDKTGTGWSYSKDSHILLLTGDTVLSGECRSGAIRVVVPGGGASKGTLDGLNLASASTQTMWSPFVVSNECALAFTGTNVIDGAGDYCAGIEVAPSATLTLEGTGVLNVTGGKYAAAIGSCGATSKGVAARTGVIKITGGEIHATGGDDAAGVGGGAMCNLTAGNIAVSGGRLVAQGGVNAAGLGSGYVGSSSGTKELPKVAVAISGGTVIATKGAGAAANIGDLIMSGNSNSPTGGDGSLVITGGSVVGRTGNVKPLPVNAESLWLSGVLVSNLAAHAKIDVTGLPATFGVNDIYADADGTICLWLPPNDKDDERDAYTFTAGGSTWRVRFTETGFCAGTVVTPEEMAIVSLSISGAGPRLTIVADNPAWVRQNASSLRIRASATPSMTEKNSVLLVPDVEINDDGSAILSVPQDDLSGAMFFKVEQVSQGGL